MFKLFFYIGVNMTISIKKFMSLAVAFSILPVMAQAETVIKIHHDMTEDSAQQEGIERFKELVERRSNNFYKVEIYPNNSLGDDIQVAQQMQFGAVEAAPIPTAKLSGFNKNLQLFDMPFLFPSRSSAYALLDGEIGNEVMSGLRKAGFEPVMFWESGFKQLTCNHEVKSPSDLSGRKVRVMESPLLIAQYKVLGANPVPISFSETYTALQQGVVECQENPMVSITKMKFNEVQKDLMLTNHGYLATAFMFSKVWFDKQEESNKKMLREAAIDAGNYERERSVAREKSYIDEVISSGNTKIVRLSDKELKEFSDAMKPLYNEYKNKLDDDLLERAQATIRNQ